MQIRDLDRLFIYHSPQCPGFTSWCGLWTMPGGAPMCSFTQATGPFRGRPAAPPEVRQRLEWPPQGHTEAYDMTGLRLQNLHLHSADQGRTWRACGSDEFRTCMNGITGEAELALPDGTLLRGVWGRYLPYDPVPQDGYVQRSGDGGNTWSAPELINRQPGAGFWPKRLRLLRDGRVLAGGGFFRNQSGRDTRTGWFADFFPALYTSGDGGRTWEGPLPVLPPDQGRAFSFTEEFDWAELENGDLLLVLRAGVAEGRLQARLPRQGAAWDPAPALPNGLPHSGHPELLLTSGGQLLHLATTGISCSLDQGRTWVDLPLDDGLDALRKGPATPYYPRSVELADGRILVVGHVGGDDGYGCTDQAIIGLRFSLA
jgi:hypothetical protein